MKSWPTGAPLMSSSGWGSAKKSDTALTLEMFSRRGAMAAATAGASVDVTTRPFETKTILASAGGVLESLSDALIHAIAGHQHIQQRRPVGRLDIDRRHHHLKQFVAPRHKAGGLLGEKAAGATRTMGKSSSRHEGGRAAQAGDGSALRVGYQEELRLRWRPWTRVPRRCPGWWLDPRCRTRAGSRRTCAQDLAHGSEQVGARFPQRIVGLKAGLGFLFDARVGGADHAALHQPAGDGEGQRSSPARWESGSSTAVRVGKISWLRSWIAAGIGHGG